jgi:hypothetical protein
MRKFIRQWRRRYPYPAAWIDNRANKQCRRSEREWLAQFAGAEVLKRREVAALIEWKFGGQANRKEQALGGIASPAAWGHARRCIKKALAASSPTVALDHLLGERGGISGWGPAMASVVLAACRPGVYTIADQRALRTLKALDVFSPHSQDEFVRLDWLPYLKVCGRLARLGDMSLRDVDQALWAAADRAPQLPDLVRPKRRHKT